MNFLKACAVLLVALPAQAVVVRGHVRDPLGRPLPGARVQLIQGQQSVASAFAAPDGSYEIRAAATGRFLLLASSALNSRYPAVQIGLPFYGGGADQVEQDLFLDPAYLTPQVSAQATLLAAALPEQAERTTQIAADQFLTAATPLAQLRQIPSLFVVGRGTAGTLAQAYVRGGGPQTVKVRVAGVTAEDLGGGFNLATLSTLGLGAVNPAPVVELTPGALPLYGVDAEGGVLGVGETRATEVRPSLTLTADGGNLAALRGAGEGEITRRRAELRGGFSRFDTDSGVPDLGFHVASAEVNAGYSISAGTGLRLLARRDVAAAPLAVPREVFGLQPAGKDAAQNLYASLTFDTTTSRLWHNRVRYGLARKRREVQAFGLPAEGLPVTLRGAGGIAVSGVAAFDPLPARDDLVTDRDEGTYETDYPLSEHHTGLLRFSYMDERAADLLPGARVRFDRKHVGGAVELRGDLFAERLRHRLRYEAAGAADHSSALGWLAAPRVGLTFVPVFPGVRRMRGTTLHAVAATGFGEPGIAALEFAQANSFAPAAPRSRTYSFAVDQVLLPQKLSVRASYFHSQYAHQDELLAFRTVSPTLAYRAQGLETSVHYQPFPRIYVAGGYTYLASLVEQTAQQPVSNPGFPAQPIGALGALAGSRPFNRPPNSGWLAAHYTGPRLALALDGSFAGRSDSSTGVPQTPGLLLPNRDLSPGFVALNASAMLRLTVHLAVYTEADNLLDYRHIAPFGYLSTPFLARAGLRFRLGGD